MVVAVVIRSTVVVDLFWVSVVIVGAGSSAEVSEKSSTPDWSPSFSIASDSTASETGTVGRVVVAAPKPAGTTISVA